MLCFARSHGARQHVMHNPHALAVAKQPHGRAGFWHACTQVVPHQAVIHVHLCAWLDSHLVASPVYKSARIGLQTLPLHPLCKRLAMHEHTETPDTIKSAITGLSIDRDTAVALHSRGNYAATGQCLPFAARFADRGAGSHSCHTTRPRPSTCAQRRLHGCTCGLCAWSCARLSSPQALQPPCWWYMKDARLDSLAQAWPIKHTTRGTVCPEPCSPCLGAFWHLAHSLRIHCLSQGSVY